MHRTRLTSCLLRFLVSISLIFTKRSSRKIFLMNLKVAYKFHVHKSVSTCYHLLSNFLRYLRVILVTVSASNPGENF